MRGIVRGKTLCQNIFPAVGGLFATYLYNVVDGIFVGQGVGAQALGAVNVAVPFITFTVALAAMFPMGGATVVAIRVGRGDQEGANRAFMTALMLTAAVSCLLMAVGMVFSRLIVDFSGGRQLSEAMRGMAVDYLFYYTAFSVPMLLSTCLSVFVRNDGSPGLSFAGMCTGAVANIFLDWLFIFPMQWGVIGAAVASGLGQVASLLVLLTHFVRRKGILRMRLCPLDGALVRKICKRGVPEAISQLNTPVTALCYNLVLARLVGDLGVSTFSVLSYIFSLANAILSGVAQGLQPLWGRAYGRRDTEEVYGLFRVGAGMNLGLSVVVCGGLILLDRPVIHIFNQDPALVQAAAAALPVFSLSFIPMALNLVYTAFLYSTKRTIPADAIAVCRGIAVKAAAIFALPAMLGVEAVWAAPLAAELGTLLLAVYLMRRTPLADP